MSSDSVEKPSQDRSRLPDPVEKPAQDRYRQMDPSDLRRITAAFRNGGDSIGDGSNIFLRSLADTQQPYLDANVFNAVINLVATTEPPFTGTRWLLQLNKDSSWSLLNQGIEDRLLARSGTSVGMGRESAGFSDVRFSATRWLIYRDRIGFRLRPGSGNWLAVREGRVELSNADRDGDRGLYWDILAAT